MKRIKRNKRRIKKNISIVTACKRKIPIYFKKIPNYQKADGWCYDPESDDPRIVIEKNLKTRRKLNVLIEEVTHAFYWDSPEYKVRKFAAELGKIIYKLFVKKRSKD